MEKCGSNPGYWQGTAVSAPSCPCWGPIWACQVHVIIGLPELSDCFPSRAFPLLPPSLQVRGSWGLQRTNRELAAGLQQAMRQRLRWSSRPEDQATLAVLHIKVG